MSELQFLGLGGTDEVGASSYLYLLSEGNLLIDAGVRPGGVGAAALGVNPQHRTSRQALLGVMIAGGEFGGWHVAETGM